MTQIIKVNNMNVSFVTIKRLIAFGFITILSMFSMHSYATECGVLQLQNNRSSGVTIQGNKCKISPNISMGTVFNVSAKGRLWLKSNPSVSKASSEFQMICQNRTDTPLQLEFSDMLMPWLNQAKLKKCSGWIENKLSCLGQKGEKNGLYCVLSFFKSLKGSQVAQIERTTSVKMRDIQAKQETNNISTSFDKQKILDAIKPELLLCKKLNQISNNMQVGWLVDQTEAKQEIDIVSTQGVNHFSLFECVKTVVSTFSYPYFKGKVAFDSKF